MNPDWKNFKIETACNSMTLHRSGRWLELRSRDGALQSRIDVDAPHRLALKNLECMLAALLFVPSPRRVLMLGTAAGSLLHHLRHHLEVDVTAVDIDAELIERLIDLGVLPPAQPGLTYVHADAAQYLARCDARFDLVLVDLFNGAHSPRWLLDKPVLGRLRGLLAARGALACNLLIASESDFRRFYRDLRLVFERRTLSLPVAGFDNTIALAFAAQPDLPNLQAQREQARALGTALDIDMEAILAAIYNTNPVGGGVL